MQNQNPAALEFLQQRRSRPAKTLTSPSPDRATLEALLTVAARTPDHGKLEPWRFIVLEQAALKRLASAVPTRGTELSVPKEKIDKMVAQFLYTDLAVAVISSPKSSDKIPIQEQIYSAAAACYGLLSASLAAGWGANWLSGWASHDRTFVQNNLGLAEPETVVGFVHIGTETATPPERPRPDLTSVVTWVDQ
ncbi:MAG: nitroreductase [Pseudomonadota bacterium]